MQESGGGFVTAAEAARLLGIPERTARRWAATLPASDRQTAASGRHRFRLSSLSTLAESARGGGHVAESSATDSAQVRPTSASGGHVAELENLRMELVEARQREAEADKRAAVAEARAELLEKERDRLTETLTREQETARAALLLAARRSGLMIEGERVEPAERDPNGASEERAEASGSPRRASWWARLWASAEARR